MGLWFSLSWALCCQAATSIPASAGAYVHEYVYVLNECARGLLMRLPALGVLSAVTA